MTRKRRQATTAEEETKVTPEETSTSSEPNARADGQEEEVTEPETPEVETPPVQNATKSEVQTSVLVAPGKSIGTRSRGIAKAGDPVTPKDFSAGDKRIEELVAAGYLVRK